MISPSGSELARDRAERLRADFDGSRRARRGARAAIGRWLIRAGNVLEGADRPLEQVHE
jgi:hypothetical protein